MKKIIFTLVIGLLLGNHLQTKEQHAEKQNLTSFPIQIAQDFLLYDLSGKKVTLKDFKNKLVLLNFFATWCPYCIKEIPELLQLNKKYKNSGLVILGINIQETKNKLLKFVDKKKVDYPILLDLDAQVANMYSIRGIPTNVLIDRNGVVQYHGNLLPDENLIKSLLPEKINFQIEIGKKVPDFTLLDINENKVILNNYFKMRFPVFIWFTNLCSSCQANIPTLEELYRKYKNSIEFLAISQLGRDTTTVKKVKEKLKITFKLLIDPDGNVCKLYTGEYVPNTCPLNNAYFIDKNGVLKFIFHYPGMDKEELEKKIEYLISGKIVK